MNTRNPKVFICHARKDKERFVNLFVERLKEHGVDVWIDAEQLLPGDRLVEKIFNEGIEKADVFMIILSKYSVNKPWVKEELEAGFIRRIDERMKIIPIVIEDCVVPSFLKSTLWQKIDDINSYDNEFDRILNAIFNTRSSQEVGEPPKYSTVVPLSHLTKIDTIIFSISCEISMNKGHYSVDTSNLFEKLAGYEISKEEVYESLEILDEKGLIVGIHEISSVGISHFNITPYGFEIYGQHFIENFEGIQKDVIVTALNEGIYEKSEIAKHLNISEGLIYHILLLLDMKGYIQVQQYISGTMEIDEISASAKREIRDL